MTYENSNPLTVWGNVSPEEIFANPQLYLSEVSGLLMDVLTKECGDSAEVRAELRKFVPYPNKKGKYRTKRKPEFAYEVAQLFTWRGFKNAQMSIALLAALRGSTRAMRKLEAELKAGAKKYAEIFPDESSEAHLHEVEEMAAQWAERAARSKKRRRRKDDEAEARRTWHRLNAAMMKHQRNKEMGRWKNLADEDGHEDGVVSDNSRKRGLRKASAKDRDPYKTGEKLRYANENDDDSLQKQAIRLKVSTRQLRKKLEDEQDQNKAASKNTPAEEHDVDYMMDVEFARNPQGSPEPPSGNMKVVAPDLPGQKPKSPDHRKLLERCKALGNPMELVEAEVTPEEIRERLMSGFPWHKKTIDSVCRDLRLRRDYGNTAFHLKPTLLVGAPGTGKTRLCITLARYLGVHYSTLSLAGAADDRMLRGTGNGWSTASPSFPVEQMVVGKCANPMIVLDELDKCKADGRNGDPHATLLTFLEPMNAKVYLDEALVTNVDLSHVNWIATANDASHIPMPLQSRFKVIEVPRPSAEHVQAIIRGVREDFAENVGADVRFVPELDDAEIAFLEKAFGKNPNIRVLVRLVERLLVRRENFLRERPN